MFQLLPFGLRHNVNSMRNFSRMLFSSDAKHQTCFELTDWPTIAGFRIPILEFNEELSSKKPQVYKSLVDGVSEAIKTNKEED